LHDDFRINAPGFDPFSLKLQIRPQFFTLVLMEPAIGRNGNPRQLSQYGLARAAGIRTFPVNPAGLPAKR